jgi:uncharacterized FlgJ-related protein
MKPNKPFVMKTQIIFVVLVMLMISSAAIAQTAATSKNKKQKSMKSKNMNTYVIERQIPDAGKLNAEQLQGISQKSCSVITELGPDIEWVHSYVTDNKIFCIYKAENEQILRTHAEKGGFPINSINKVSTVISPATATAKLADVIR